MKILQLIDTLHPGGAERMAVNYANALNERGHDSHLICTREEGAFKALLSSSVSYLLLNKKSVFDIPAFLKLRKYISLNNIELLHAHGSSWFFAVLCKMLKKDLKVIWHDHYGGSENLEKRSKYPLQYFSQFLDGIICVNEKLEKWAKSNLSCDNLICLNNFIYPHKNIKSEISIDKDAFNIVCLANLRPQKDHLTLLKACDIVSKKQAIALHVIGKDFGDDYSRMIKKEFEKRSYLIYHGEVLDNSFLEHMDLGVLSSKSEGLPLALLEYGFAGVHVVCTNVGDCKKVVREDGILVPPGDVEALKLAINGIINKTSIHNRAESLKGRIWNEYSVGAVIPKYERFCEELC